MSYDTFSFSDFLSATFASGQDLPLTIVVWVRRSGAAWAETGIDFAVQFGNDFSSQLPSVGIGVCNGAADSACITAATASTQDISSNASFTDGTYDDTWVPLIGVWSSITDRTVYVGDSSVSVSDATSKDEGSALDSLIAGRSLNGGLEFNGQIAEVAVFTAAWTTTLVDQVMTGSETGPAPNTIDESNCIGYWPLDTDQATHADQSGNSGPNMVENGSTAFNSDHPTISSVTGSPLYYYAQL